MTFPVTEHTVKTNRHTTGYLACGAEGAPLLVFCNGWPELSLSWRHQLPAMAALGFRCVAPDMRGYGRSSTYTRHEDFTQELIVAAPGSSSRLNWTALNALAGTKLKLLTGYEGPASAKNAMERGEVEAMSLPWAVLQAENPEWLRDKKVNLLLQTGLEKNRTLPDLPRMVDLPKSDDDRKVLEIFALSSVVGRSFVAPPAVPKERIDELRTAFMATVKDADFLADIAKLNLDLEPMAGAELQAFIAKDYPPALTERAKEIARRN